MTIQGLIIFAIYIFSLLIMTYFIVTYYTTKRKLEKEQKHGDDVKK